VVVVLMEMVVLLLLVRRTKHDWRRGADLHRARRSIQQHGHWAIKHVHVWNFFTCEMEG
jgi:hypothetical protein